VRPTFSQPVDAYEEKKKKKKKKNFAEIFKISMVSLRKMSCWINRNSG